MEDATKHPRETGDDVQEPEIEVAGNEVGGNGENLRSDEDKSENEWADSESIRNEAIHRTAIEQDDALCAGGDPVNAEFMNDDTKEAGNVSEEPTGDKSATGKQTGEEDRDCVEHVSIQEKDLEDSMRSDPEESMRISLGNGTPKTQGHDVVLYEGPLDEDEEMENAANANPDKAAENELQKEVFLASSIPDQHKSASPISHAIYPPPKAGEFGHQPMRTTHTHETLPLMPEDDDGTLEEQAAFMREVESYYRQKGMDFKPPRFYQQPLNCLKLWRAVIRLGGYEKVTACKLWRQVGESFHPPKTCTTVSWTFRIFFEKALLEYEKYQIQIGALQFPALTLGEAPAPVPDKEVNGHHGSETGRARRDAAARAMQGWHSQRHSSNGEVGEPVIKSKNVNSMSKREKNLKSIGVGPLKQKRPNDLETPNKVARTEIPEQLVASVVDIGPPADWVKINVRQTTDCFEVYALVPGLIREEVRVQSDPAGRLVITGQPEQLDNPWGITPFKKVVTLPARIDPLHTSAVVSLHGGLFVRVPFEQQTGITTA